MQGEFRGDFTRDTFDPRKHFLRVLMQQGRVQLDADWNEQVAILLHYLQTLAADLIGEHGGPVRRSGFKITVDQDDIRNDTLTNFKISTGRYYVNGILCENDLLDDQDSKDNISYYDQKDYPLNQKKDFPEIPFLVYLDVWERHITYIEDETDFIPGIREVALGGPDTATRSRLVWQVKAEPFAQGDRRSTINTCQDVISNWSQLIQTWQPHNRGLLKAMARGEENQTDPCIIRPDSRYRRPENQLYRVEIHKGGQIDAEPTFKWSRENGAVVFPIDPDSLPVSGTTATIRLKSLWRDERFGLADGDWVEIIDDDYVLHQRSEPLWKVDKIEPLNLQITLTREQGSNLAVGTDPLKHPLLRRWEQKARSGLTLEPDGTIKVAEVGKNNDLWITLEDGVQIQFQGASDSNRHFYRTGDYWLIPARTAIGDVEWVKSNGKPVALPPHGIHHHYAPLAVIAEADNESGFTVSDCRRQFYSLARTYGYVGSAEGIGSELIFPDD